MLRSKSMNYVSVYSLPYLLNIVFRHHVSAHPRRRAIFFILSIPGGGRGGIWPMFGYRGAAKGLKS